MLERLREPATASELAADQDCDSGRLRALLEYVRLRTDIVLRSGPDGYVLNPEYGAYHQLGFHLDKLIGAYGPLVANLDESLRPGAPCAPLVDEQALASAFGAVEGSAGVTAQADVIESWSVRSLLDLGCGPGALLVELASREPAFRGCGVDKSAAMCRLAVESVAGAGHGDAVQIVQADVRDVDAYADTAVSRSVDALHCKSLLNEFFGSGPSEASRVVAALGRQFRGRLLFVTDYYGKLGSVERVDDAHAHTLVHDVAQVLSGQGVPPPSLAKWTEVYAQAGVELMHAYEGEADGIAWFIHVVRL
jgi:SAM-dependent methyltransferase